MQLRKQNANAPGLDSRRSSLNVFSCFFNRLFNKLFTQLRRSFPLFITNYGKHFLLLFIERPVDFVFFLSYLTIYFCLHMSEDLRITGGAVLNSFHPFYCYYYNFSLLKRVYLRVYLRCSLYIEWIRSTQLLLSVKYLFGEAQCCLECSFV